MPDSSFSMSLSQEDMEAAQALIPKEFQRNKIAIVSPSRVAEIDCQRNNVNYVGVLADAVRRLLELNYKVLIVPHSLMRGNSKNNDVSVVERLGVELGRQENVHIISPPENSKVLRALFSFAQIAVTSRYHATVAALSAGVPPITISWSYKYVELLQIFGIPDQLVSTDKLDSETLIGTLNEVEISKTIRSERILCALSQVTEDAAANYAKIKQYVAGAR